MDEILGFKGWAAETINGRLAMLGFVYAVVGEFTEGKTFLGQVIQQMYLIRICKFVRVMKSPSSSRRIDRRRCKVHVDRSNLSYVFLVRSRIRALQSAVEE